MGQDEELIGTKMYGYQMGLGQPNSNSNYKYLVTGSMTIPQFELKGLGPQNGPGG